MWQKLIDWAKYFQKHKEQTEKNSADIKEQERTIKELALALQRAMVLNGRSWLRVAEEFVILSV